MITTGTPGYVTLKNILVDLAVQSDDQIASYLNTLSYEDLFTLEQIAVKERMEVMTAIIHAHQVGLKYPAREDFYRKAVDAVMAEWVKQKRYEPVTNQFAVAMSDFRVVHENRYLTP